MKIKYDVNVPSVQRQRGEAYNVIAEFMASDRANLKFECENAKEAQKVYNCARTVMAGGMRIKAMKRGNDVYVLRKDDK